MKKTLWILFALILSLPLFADQKGEEIAKKHFDLKKADDSFGIATMVIMDKSGKKIRKMEMYTKQFPEGQNSFVRFLEPADVKDTKFLTITHKNSDDEQRLYLPAMNKTRRIASDNKDGSFVGSDLYYYDLEDRKYEDYSYKFLRDETYNSMDCFVVEMTSNDKNAPYSKSIAWVNKKDYFIYRIDAFDRKKNELLKKFTFVEVKEFKGVLIPTKIAVENVREQTRTLMQTDNLQVNSGIKADIFSVQNLEK
jgi:outer membrane lipoprotein-sorting protein